MGSIGVESQAGEYRIGVDVGGTNTDAVLISLRPIQIIASHKAPTTADVTTGINEAVRALIRTSNVPLDTISCVIIGTTHFVNAVVQRSSSLHRVGVVRLCGGAEDGFGLGVPPFIDFPRDLRHLISTQPFFCQGGHQISGTEISPIDEAEVKSVAEKLVKDGIFDVAISGIYSPLNSAHEVQAGDILLKHMNETSASLGLSSSPRVTLSHQISSVGFLARENAAILNASLRPLAEKTILAFQKAMQDIFEGSPCALYLTQNDGSVLSAPDAIDLPIRTFNSGPTNSISGGDFLWNAASMEAYGASSQRQDSLVVIDIGGTTSDSGLLLPNGLPRMSSIMSLVGGVRTNFALPAVESIGLGGGSIVQMSPDKLTVGPESVGFQLPQKARLFGGDVLTTTDIVAANHMHSPAAENPLKGLGDLTRLTDITPDIVKKAKAEMRRLLEDLVDRTKIQKGDIDVLIVGGGAILIDEGEILSGVRAVRKVKGGEVANAVGAAISRVSGVVDTVVDTSHQSLKQAQETVATSAIDAAVMNGAQRDTVQIVEVTVLPIQYVDAKARIVVRAVGVLDVVKISEQGMSSAITLPKKTQQSVHQAAMVEANLMAPNKEIKVEDYKPHIEKGHWIVSAIDLEWIANGCRVLGCGGGGDPYQQYLKIKSVVEKSPGAIKIVSPLDLPEGSTIGCTGCMGSPEVSMERMEADECNKAHDALIRVMQLPPVDGFLALEIGGGNGMVNLEVAAAHGVPCVDADYMGRAYPTYWQTTINVYGTPRGEALLPATIASGDGSFMTMTASRTDKLVDSALRASTVEMGCRAGKAGPPKPGRVVQEQAIHNTVSLAWWIGRAIALEKNIAERASRIVESVGGSANAKVLAEGKITNVERVLRTGHTYGIVEIDGLLNDGSAATIKIPFKNENAYVEAVGADGAVSILASVPDLIVVLDSETGSGLGTPEYKYGLKVAVIAIAASPRWTDTRRGLELGGPGSMGFDDIQYVPIGRYTMPRSVIEAYS
ncbi:hypothetical protein LTR10_019840 [Elasticomyces elasticus]|uniref:Hydantoinase/oxoprolinase n=1 Tax=Exophiala sideris TaxID=1016849 RepID=A0ABR0J2N5_9EURO|nr:hypothetical protein LTR10_019840 [Elasticomyces elasticus]KAK5024424.1 hypothetical protein LTS07_008715 [Exophiala sideris]KAK5030894.1 hypothetical protein LTR13_007907 [Exophiala sideris]KAK5054157.1 hypothetical protein LTR69_009119 [Exophiala sideris]KAK5179487.1 hypothetical protein LTR44_008003 [Eurotiomycetes sp. CCFEE 6388]